MSKKNNELKIIRVYEASIDAVWEAWTDPEQVAKWWGPRGFTLTTHSKELKSGGHWHYTMHGPDGTDYPNITTYLEVETKRKLVYDHGANDKQPPLFRVTVFFEEIQGKTQMDMTMTFLTPEEALQAKKFIKEAGGNSTWDRLAEYLEKESSQKDIFVINRSFEASIETVYEAWTQPESLSQWMGPKATNMELIDNEIAVGKTIFYKMTYGSGVTLYGKVHYIQMTKPSYLEYTQIFCTKEGELSKHPMVPVWPDTLLTKIFFTKEGEEQTRVTVVWQPHGEVSPEESQAFAKMRDGITLGWTESFDKLERHLT